MSKVYSVIAFYSEWELGVGDDKTKFYYRTPIQFGVEKQRAEDFLKALKCSKKELIVANDFSELKKIEFEKIKGFQNFEEAF